MSVKKLESFPVILLYRKGIHMASDQAAKIKEINLKISQLSKIVSEISELSNNVRKSMNDDYCAGMTELSNAWAGDTANDLLDKSQEILKDTVETSGKISEAMVKAVEMIKRYAALEAAACGITLK
jgi:methyl-accepting chemotaxis protein